MKKPGSIFLALLFANLLWSQDSTTTVRKVTVNGYIKDLQTLSFDHNFQEMISGNVIHNRINGKWKPSKRVTLTAEFRNRLFWGEEVKLTPGFVSLLRNQNEGGDLHVTWVKTPSFVFHTNTERLFLDYQTEKMKIRIGRQRINWEIATTWNPNDIFNVYNFLDFDYEERPGVDGGTYKQLFSNSSSLELAYSQTKQRKGNIVALRYALNKWNYDLQLIAGWYKDRFSVGTGWAGNVKDAGFKGELQYFKRNHDTTGILNLSVEGDYLFKKGWYISAGFLLNDKGLNRPIKDWTEIDLQFSPTHLMPAKWNMIITTAKEFSPLVSTQISTIYSPGPHLLILYPSFSYNMATNLDILLSWQSFFIELDGHFQSNHHRCFIRFKWNF